MQSYFSSKKQQSFRAILFFRPKNEIAAVQSYFLSEKIRLFQCTSTFSNKKSKNLYTILLFSENREIADEQRSNIPYTGKNLIVLSLYLSPY